MSKTSVLDLKLAGQDLIDNPWRSSPTAQPFQGTIEGKNSGENREENDMQKITPFR